MEIEQALRFLTSTEASKIPMDIVTIGADNILGAPWSVDKHEPNPNDRKGPQPSLTHIAIKRETISPRGNEVIANRIKFSKIPVFKPDPDNDKPGILTSSETNFVYFSRLMDPIRLMVDNFLPLACALFGNWQKSKGYSGINPTESNNFEKIQKAYLEGLATAWEMPKIAKANEALTGLRTTRDESISAIFKKSFSKFAKKNEMAELNCEKVDDQRTLLFKRYEIAESTQDRNDWRDIRTVLSSNRYSLTLLLAAAQEIVLTAKNWLDGAKLAEGFIFNTINKVRSVSEQESETIVLRAVLDIYRSFHEIGCPWRDFELHDHLLRNIAVINSPISANVIVRLPAIRAYFDSLGEVSTSNISRRRSVAAALIYLGERGLAFRLSSHFNLVVTGQKRSTATKIEPSWPEIYEYRFGLHRIVQRYYISKLGSRTFEPVKTNNFAPSRYASLPSDGPRLNHEALKFLRAMLVALSQYPDLPQQTDLSLKRPFASASNEAKIQALRAALTMIRSVFSFAVVSRFEDYKNFPGEKGKLARGYFETYKVRLRWILRKAWEAKPISDADTPTINALYRDEIVWLYNEIGITCLVQGNLTESVSYLRQALWLNREIEGQDDNGPQSSIIGLNLAITQIERGRLDKAYERLEAIVNKEKHIRADTYYLCQGYLGLCGHLTGRKSKAEVLFKNAIEFFLKQDDLRALAIFRGHLGRLLADRDPKAAKEHLQRGLENAEAGGHEDIRHKILAAQVRVSLVTNSPDRPEQNHAILDEVEEYARIMETPALLCDAAHNRAHLLIAGGDTATAGQHLVRAMAIARRNQMNLRLNSMITTYAQVQWMRGKTIPARRLCYASLEMAKQGKYALEIDRALLTLRRWTGEV